MIKSYSRGHEIIYVKNKWVYKDNGKQINDKRPCAKCGEKPTIDGYDKCIGKIKGATSACCGHGVEEKYIVMSELSKQTIKDNQ